MKFKVEVTVDNAAFEGEQLAYELARILRELADRAPQYVWPEMDRWPLRDVNGNKVGFAEFEE